MHASLRRILIAATDAVPIEIPHAEILALRTVFASEETARAAWFEYRKNEFEVDSIYRSTGTCLLPILGARLSELFPDDPWLGRLTG